MVSERERSVFADALRDEGGTERARIEVSVVPADHSVVLEGLQPSVAWGDAESHPFGGVLMDVSIE